MAIYNSIDELVGNTPLIRLLAIEERIKAGAEIYAKLEYFNPTGSVKDRAAKYMLDAAEREGKITPETVIIEPTSGNTGIGLAAIASSRRLRSIIVMPNSMSPERAALMRALGAEVVLTDGSLGMAGAVAMARELAKSFPSAFIPSQFENPEGKRAHYETTGPEIYRDLDGKVDIFIAGVGTGGTLSGVGEYLKEKNPAVQIIAVEPADSPLLSGGTAAAHKLQGIGANFIPELLNRDIYDEVIGIGADEAYEQARLIGKLMGIGVGISSGAALAAAAKVATRPECSGKRIAVLLPDGAEKYLSTDLFS